MNNELNIVPSIKLSVKQTFGIDSNLEVDAFEKKNEFVPVSYTHLTLPTNA